MLHPKKGNNNGDYIYTKSPQDNLILLAGNPNVGKSTAFNALTGLKQHTGNWTGKTVMSAFGTYSKGGKKYVIADIPGCYSLKSGVGEEKCAGDAISFGSADAVIVICSALALERNLNLVLQICEASDNVVVGINLADEGEKKGIKIDCDVLEQRLGIRVVRINARKKRGLDKLVALTQESTNKPIKISYGKTIEHAVQVIEKTLPENISGSRRRYLAIRLLEGDKNTQGALRQVFKSEDSYEYALSVRNKLLDDFENEGITREAIKEKIILSFEKTACDISRTAVSLTSGALETKFVADKILTGPVSSFLIMFLMLGVIFYITLRGANKISDALSLALSSLEPLLHKGLIHIGTEKHLADMLVLGGYRVLSWVVSVMLPPMAIFFPLFTILEDVGYLPRIAFNLDRAFKKCKSCGKQALTTCMGFGCNAAAVSGARIIDSPRERLIAIITNSFIPCNGRFPALICLISIFFPLTAIGFAASSMYLVFFVILAIVFSLLASWLLSKTLLKGVPSSFSLELPSFQKPQFGEIIIRSLVNRTAFVLARAVAVAFPAGIVLWLLTNIKFNDNALINYMVSFLDPVGRLMGMDGTILTAFILGIPANEIVLPIALMIYSSGSVLTSFEGYDSIYKLLVSNGWTLMTAVCVIVFFIMHWPCSTTLMTIKKETKSLTWTIVSFLMPTLFGMLLCMIINLASFLV